MTTNPTPKKRAKQKAKAIPESVIETQILTWLFYKGIFAWKNITGGYFDARLGRHRKQRSPFAINGVSDIIGIYMGRPLFIECKADKGRLSEDQKAFLEKAKARGAIAFVARSVGDVEENLKTMDQRGV